MRIILAALVLIFTGFLVISMQKILEKLAYLEAKAGTWYYKCFGTYFTNLHRKFERKAYVEQKGNAGKLHRTVNKLLVDLGWKADGVTVSGMLLFMLLVPLGVTILLSIVMNTLRVVVPLSVTLTYLFYITLKLYSLGKKEKLELAILDAVDLIVADIGNGVHNAIVRYTPNLPIEIRKNFEDFLRDIDQGGYGFREAMLRLADNLGPEFEEFALKAIQYEMHADDTLIYIFSSVMLKNRKKRELRGLNALRFRKLKIQFITSMALILLYGMITILLDHTIVEIILHTRVGQVCLIVDLFIVAWVLGYMAVKKSEVFE